MIRRPKTTAPREPAGRRLGRPGLDAITDAPAAAGR